MTVFAPVDTLASLQVWNWLVRLCLRLAANAVVALVVQTLETVAGSLVSLWHFGARSSTVTELSCIHDASFVGDSQKFSMRRRVCKLNKFHEMGWREQEGGRERERKEKKRERDRENDRQRHREAKLNSILMNIDWLLLPWGKLKAIGASAGRSRKFTAKLLSL